MAGDFILGIQTLFQRTDLSNLQDANIQNLLSHLTALLELHTPKWKNWLPFGLNYELTMVEICRSLVGILIEWNDLASSEATHRGIYSTVYTISFYSKKRWFPPVSALTLNINIAGKKNGALAIVNKLLNISFSHYLYPY